MWKTVFLEHQISIAVLNTTKNLCIKAQHNVLKQQGVTKLVCVRTFLTSAERGLSGCQLAGSESSASESEYRSRPSVRQK